MKEIISCSRRTDIPAFYYEWLQQKLKDGSVDLVNPYSNEKYKINLSSDNVHSIVLWSKNYKNLIDNPGLLSNYSLYFQFTINGYSSFLEPMVIPLEEAVNQARTLAKRYSPDQINWRFDPIILSKQGEIVPTENVEDARLSMFEEICKKLSAVGIQRCTISFAILYPKVCERFSSKSFEMKTLDDLDKINFTKKLVEISSRFGISIFSCSEPLLENIDGIQKSHCIDGEILESLFGTRASKAKDAGQRKACGCSKSRDIGDYNQLCHHRCLYCYARIS